MATLLVSMREMPWAARARHALMYGLIVLALLTPYLLFIQWNGGLRLYFTQASAWAERDRDRAPVVWPGLFDNPDGVSDEARTGGPIGRAIAAVRDNGVAWLYYTRDPAAVFRALPSGRVPTTDSDRPGRAHDPSWCMVADAGRDPRCGVPAQPAGSAAGGPFGTARHPRRLALCGVGESRSQQPLAQRVGRSGSPGRCASSRCRPVRW